jgi:perosamine synthetase
MTEKLAIEGGKPVREKLLPYGRQTVDDEDIAEVVRVLRSDWLTTGPDVGAFEKAFMEVVGARYAVASSSGTAALHSVMFAAKIGPGDEVVVPAMTFAATANCVRFQGGTVAFADVRADTLNLDVASAEAALTPRTRAVVAVNFAGQPADLEELKALCDRRGILFIEDACHAIGATYHGRPAGSYAQMSAYSLHPVKNITTGEGGLVTTDDPGLAARLKMFRNHGITTDLRQREASGSWFYEMVELGYNYRITDFQCALGTSQLRKFPAWQRRRAEIAERYGRAFAQIPEVEAPSVLPDRTSAWHLYVLRLNLDRLRAERAEIFKALRAENIGVNVHYIPVPWHPYYRDLGYARGSWPVAEANYERILSLPMFPAMTDRDIEDVVEAIRKVVGHYST